MIINDADEPHTAESTAPLTFRKEFNYLNYTEFIVLFQINKEMIK